MKFYEPDVRALAQRYIARGDIKITQNEGLWTDILRSSPNVRRYIPGPNEICNGIRAVLAWADSNVKDKLPVDALRDVFRKQLHIIDGLHLTGKSS